jgi:hypothetical protein
MSGAIPPLPQYAFISDILTGGSTSLYLESLGGNPYVPIMSDDKKLLARSEILSLEINFFGDLIRPSRK